MMQIKKIVKIEELDNIEYVYDPCCDNPHNYIANGVVSHNCCLWVDEIEKGLSGLQSSGASDGGTTSRVLSTFLTWMQEKTASVFVVATANDHSAIPPEFQRAGRFDEVFFVDFPSLKERIDIYRVLLNRKKYNPKEFDLEYLASNSKNYSGAEIEKSIDEAMLVAFIDNKRKITTDDIIYSLKAFKPLYEMRKDEFDSMREWANSRCLLANSPDDTESSSLNIRTTRQLDI